MKRLLLLLFVLILWPAESMAQSPNYTTTPNLGLFKPKQGATNWGALVNSDMDIIDSISATGTSKVQSLAFSASPTFDVNKAGIFVMTLTGNVISSTLTTPANGAGRIVDLYLCQDATGGRTFAWPANVIQPATVGTVANQCYANPIFYGLDNNWHQWATGGGGGGVSPAGPGAALQLSNAGITGLATASASGVPLGVDNLTTPTVLNLPFSASAAGPNPSIDVQSPVYGGRPTNGQVSTTCTTVGGTGGVSCASLSNLKQGDGVVIYAAGSAPTLSTPAAPTVTSPWVTGSASYSYECKAIDAAQGLSAESPQTTVANAPAVFGNGPVAISNVSWTGGVATITFSATFDANFASYSANTKTVSIVGMGTGLTTLNGYWTIASEPSATSLTFAVAGSGSGTFSSATGRATNTVPGVSVTRSGSTLTATMAYALPINVNSFLAPTTVILAGWLPADINGRYALSSNLGDSVVGAVITFHNTPMNETESSTQAGTITVYEGIKVTCPNVAAPTTQYYVLGNSNPGGVMTVIGKTPYGQRTFVDYGFWLRTSSSGFYIPPYVPSTPTGVAQNDLYVGKITSITGNSMTVTPNVPSTVTSATTFHDDTTAILAAAAVLTGLGNGGSVALTPPNSPSCAGCQYHAKFPLILPNKVDLELEAPLDADETVVGAQNNGIWKGPNAVGQTTCGQFAQKKCEPLYGHANPIVAFTGPQSYLNGLVLTTNQNGTANSDDGQILAQFGLGTGAQGAESMSDDYLSTNAATTSTPLLVIGQVSPFQIRDSNFSSSWPNGGPATAGQINLLPNLGAIWARAGDNSTDNGIMPGAFNFTGNVYFTGKGFLLDSQNWTTGGISLYNLTALNDDQQPVTPYFMDYGGDLPASNVNIANITMDSNTVSLVAQMTSGNGGGNWTFINDTTSGGAPAVTGQAIPALTVKDVTPLLGQNYQYSNNTRGTYDFSGVKLMELRTSAGLTTTVNGDIGFDSTNSNWHVWNGADSILAPLATGFVSGHCGQPTSTGGKWVIADTGFTCPTSGFTAGGDLSGTATSQNVIGWDFSGTHYTLGTALTNLQVFCLSGTSVIACPGLDVGATTANTMTYTGTGGVVSTSFATSGSNGGLSGTEGTGANCAIGVGKDCQYPDSTLHCYHDNWNNVDLGCTAAASNTLTFTNKTLAGAAITGALTGTGNFIPVTLLNSGSGATSSTFWRGDGTWAAASGGGGNPAIIANDTTTGTTVNQIAVWNAGGTGAVVATAAAQGSTGNSFIGICASGCGTSGNASIVTAGYVQCTSDNAATMGHYAVQGSTGVFGECHDSGVAFGSFPPPAYSIGVFTTTGAAGLQGLNLRADASQFLGTLRLYGIEGDGPGVFNAALIYDNLNSNFTAGFQIGGNTAYGAITGGQNNVNSMLRGILTIPSTLKTISFNWPAGGGSGVTYAHTPICTVSLVETTQGTVPADGGHSVFPSATSIQVDSTNAAPAAGWVYSYICIGNPN